MTWPLSQDYNEAIQCPADNFDDPDLKRGEPTTNAFGLPLPCSGNFADVYQVRGPNGSRWAVKCFTRETPGLRERYDAISRHLRQAKLPFTVDFTYLERGIRVAGRWFPVLKMQWVEGLTLSQFAAKAADKPTTLERLLQIWKRMGKHLRAAEVAHCDLQHGNVLLVPGSGDASLALKLVDYDGMWVPALAGKKSGEVGHASYQHPRRAAERVYSLDVDRFPLLLVATALRALTVGGRALWDKYDNGDNLLFAEADLTGPGQSALFRELAALGDPLTEQLSAAVMRALDGPVGSAPLLEEAMPESRPAHVVAAATPTPLRRSPREPEGAPAPKPTSRPSRRAKATGVPPTVWVGGGVAALIVIGAVAVAIGAVLLKKGPGPEALATGPMLAGRQRGEDRRPASSFVDGRLTQPSGDQRPPARAGHDTRPKNEDDADKNVDFLVDLREREQRSYSFEKGEKYSVNGEKVPHGLLLHPFDNAPAYVVYDLKRGYSRFKAKVGVSDSANAGTGSKSPLSFSVAGDGKTLWESKRVQKRGDFDSCDIPLDSIRQITLQVHCFGSSYCAHAVWVEPRLLRR
jgi:hypothetical protein